jgi:DmsE family decaheme c-type cytochrome
MVSATALAAQAPGATAAGAPAQQTTQATFVGSDVCTQCHADLATNIKEFQTNPHSRLSMLHGNQGVTCESCHGPGSQHVDSGGDVTKIFSPATAPSLAVDTMCLTCHGDVHPNFLRSPHAEAGLSCVSCHSNHSAADPVHLLKASQPGLCFQCHTDIKPLFSMPFHHKVTEGLMNCTDCHDTHGALQQKQLQATAEQNMICTKCHMEQTGPFVYEHPVVKTEGCLSCHTPHGSPNSRLLNVSNLNTLCLQCHSATNSAAIPNALSPTGPAHNQTATEVACTNCHTQIHGSNASDVFFN